MDTVKTKARAKALQAPDFKADSRHLGPEKIHPAWDEIERRDGKVAYIVMHPFNYPEVRKFWRDNFDPENQKVLIDQGIRAYMHGAMIVTDHDMPQDVWVLMSDIEFGIELSVKLEECLEPLEAPDRDRYGTLPDCHPDICHVGGVEMQRIIEWTTKALAAHPSPPMSGSRFKFKFLDCRVGTAVYVTDLVTKEVLNATDSSDW